MSLPYYVAPEQIMKDRAEYAQKGIARGRALIASVFDNGILMIAENLSKSLHKISELHDRIAFAGVGKYNEFDQLRVAGVRHADLRGYEYSREDVDARSLANLYAQHVGHVFTHEIKPLEIEILVAEVGNENTSDQLFHVSYDGTVSDSSTFVVLGGDAGAISNRYKEKFNKEDTLELAFKKTLSALIEDANSVTSDQLEVAILDRKRKPRSFYRIEGDELAQLVARSKEGP